MDEKQRHREYSRQYRCKSKEKVRLTQRRWRLANPEKVRAYNKKSRTLRKLENLTHYSGGVPKCTRCGITDIDVLCVDHIEGGGTQHRKSLKGGEFYGWLKTSGYPSGFQVLCANCNLKKRIQEGC